MREAAYFLVSHRAEICGIFSHPVLGFVCGVCVQLTLWFSPMLSRTGQVALPSHWMNWTREAPSLHSWGTIALCTLLSFLSNPCGHPQIAVTSWNQWDWNWSDTPPCIHFVGPQHSGPYLCLIISPICHMWQHSRPTYTNQNDVCLGTFNPIRYFVTSGHLHRLQRLWRGHFGIGVINELMAVRDRDGRYHGAGAICLGNKCNNLKQRAAGLCSHGYRVEQTLPVLALQTGLEEPEEESALKLLARGLQETKATGRTQEPFLANPRSLPSPSFSFFFLGPCVSLCWNWYKLHSFLLGVELEKEAHDRSCAVWSDFAYRSPFPTWSSW